jgi:elongation factor Ts
MGKCKQALEVANGDIDLAIANLRKEGMASAVKKEGRETKEGIIASFENDGAVSLVEVNAETDFVARNEAFKELADFLAKEAATNKVSSVEEFAQMKTSKGQTVEEVRISSVQSLGENIQIKRAETFSAAANSCVGVYIHMGGKIGVVVELEGSSEHAELAREIALHIAAEDPSYITPDEVPNDVKEHEREIARAQMKGKPDHIIDKILEGKLGAFYDEHCLLRQSFVKDTSMTIAALLESKKAGLKIKRFVRWVMGE